MSTINLFRNAVKNPLPTVFFLVIAVVMAVSIYGDIQDMSSATTGYDYCQSLCYLFENICISYFMAIFFVMYLLTYINKQYSKWSIWLYYLSAVVLLIHFFISGFMFEYVYAHVEADHMDSLSSLARYIFGAPAYFVLLSLFFVPKFIKDTIKLKKEQDLTI